MGRKGLNDIASIVTPDTLMAWQRKLIAIKWDHSDKRRLGQLCYSIGIGKRNLLIVLVGKVSIIAQAGIRN